MNKAQAYWLFYIIYALFGSYYGWTDSANRVRYFGSNLLLLILLFIIGWKDFGFIINGD